MRYPALLLADLVEHVVQDPAGQVPRDLASRVEPAAQVDRLARFAGTMNGAPNARTRRHVGMKPFDVDGLGAIEPERFCVHAAWELQRHDPHADQVGSMNALDALRDDHTHAERSWSLCGPVARRAAAVLLACDHHRRHAFRDIAIGGLVDRQYLAAWEMFGETA